MAQSAVVSSARLHHLLHSRRRSMSRNQLLHQVAMLTLHLQLWHTSQSVIRLKRLNVKKNHNAAIKNSATTSTKSNANRNNMTMHRNKCMKKWFSCLARNSVKNSVSKSVRTRAISKSTTRMLKLNRKQLCHVVTVVTSNVQNVLIATAIKAY